MTIIVPGARANGIGQVRYGQGKDKFCYRSVRGNTGNPDYPSNPSNPNYSEIQVIQIIQVIRHPE